MRRMISMLMALVMVLGLLPATALAAGTDHTMQRATVEKVGQTSRTVLNLNNDWRFYAGNAPEAQQAQFDDSAWLYVNVPHSTLHYTPENCFQKNLGVFWYRRAFATPTESSNGAKVMLHFEGAMQKAEVWLNGTKLGTHEGGYTGFSFDVTPYLRNDGKENLLAVKLDTRANADFAPGKVNPDFQYFGGLYRNVTLTVLNPIHITDAVFSDTAAGGGVFLTAPAVSKAEATVKAKTEVANETTAAATVTVLTELVKDGTVVAQNSTQQSVKPGQKASVTQNLTVKNPKI